MSGRKFYRTNIVAAKLGNNIIAPFQYTGFTDSSLFEFWFEHIFLPKLPDDSIIVLDNASFHRKNMLTKLVSRYNKQIIFLPPYSPDLNPIEKVWAKIKKFLRFYLHLFSSLNSALHHIFKVI